MGFIENQRFQQAEFRRKSSSFSEAGRLNGFVRKRQYDFVIPVAQRHENLAPEIRELAIDYFGRNQIEWHNMCHHLLSSQVCCINFLMPFAKNSPALAQLLTPLYGAIEILPIEGKDVFLAFEWIGGDYLQEARAGRRTRGANCTSADAAVKFRRKGRTHIVLIEWKYTEFYGSAPASKARGTRMRRYADKVFAPLGPLKPSTAWTIPNLFYEPIYQLLRLQMLAFQSALHRDCDEASVLHISPRDNVALRQITSPRLRSFGSDLFELWPKLLADHDTFKSITTGLVFAAMAARPPDSLRHWASYVTGRYGSILN